jgi:transposase IS4-like protein/DDE family transposase
MTTFTRTVTVAGGVFGPGHLGELTQFLPFELVDDVLERTRTVQRRLRLLPSRAGVYFVLALGLFPRLGYARVWGKLVAGLAELKLACPSEKALRDLRRRLGPAPLKALFEVVAGPLAWPRTRGVTFCGLRTVAFDGCHSVQVPDSSRNQRWARKIRYQAEALAGYPALRLMALAETGTRALLGATLAVAADGDEPALARRLLHLLGPGMLVLADRAFDAGSFIADVAGTGAMLLFRARACRLPLVTAVLPDGSYLSQLDGLTVRFIDARLAITGADGSHTGDRYLLVTTLTDHRRYPAAALTALYHERWEIETAFRSLRSTLLQGRVLRSGDPAGVEQELWALLTLYQLLVMAMVTAVQTQPGTDPDRASFTTALDTAANQLTNARGIAPPGPADLAGTIGRAVLATLLPARRLRYSSRKVKSSTSRFQGRDHRPAASTTITTIDITICVPDPSQRPRRPRRPPGPRPPRPPTRRDQITTLITSHPPRPWTGHELARHLNIKPADLLSQLSTWTRAGLFTRTSPGTYTLNTHPPLTPPQPP